MYFTFLRPRTEINDISHEALSSVRVSCSLTRCAGREGILHRVHPAFSFTQFNLLNLFILLPFICLRYLPNSDAAVTLISCSTFDTQQTRCTQAFRSLHSHLGC